MVFLLSTALANEPGDTIAEVAAQYLEERPALRIEACNGLIEDVLRDAGYPMRGRVTTLYDDMQAEGWLHQEPVPFPGDIVFFDLTYDSNGNGRADDKLTHIAIVIDVDPDGTVHMVHRASSGIKPLTMNLHSPGQHLQGDRLINSYLAAPSYGEPGRQLAGELWRAFATVDGESVPPEVPQPARGAQVDRSAAPQPPPPPYGTARVVRGDALRPRQVRRHSCEELWYLRNAIFARHGYAFRTPEARTAFDALDWYTRNEDVTAQTADAWLTETDRANLRLIQDLEAHCHD